MIKISWRATELFLTAEKET